MVDSLNNLLFNNPISQKIISTSKVSNFALSSRMLKDFHIFLFSFQSILFKNGTSASVSTITTASQTVAQPVIRSLYEQGGKSSSVFIRLAGLSGRNKIFSLCWRVLYFDFYLNFRCGRSNFGRLRSAQKSMAGYERSKEGSEKYFRSG